MVIVQYPHTEDVDDDGLDIRKKFQLKMGLLKWTNKIIVKIIK